ncbi:MAG: hypothetical protein JWO53_560, partial [Chlamydiia bacterium]|nr:hypothetical protein [Chlamydiia bacterium]
MFSLVLDTATSYGVVALFQDGILLEKKEFTAAFTNSQLLLPAINALLPKKLEYIAVGVGPGSYTGIRVAVAIAKGISFALNIPLVGVSSLKGFVPELSQKGSFIAAIDARIGGVYALQGVVDQEGIRFTTKEELLSLDEFRDRLHTVTFLVTPDAELLRNRCPSIPSHIIERGPS